MYATTVGFVLCNERRIIKLPIQIDLFGEMTILSLQNLEHVESVNSDF